MSRSRLRSRRKSPSLFVFLWQKFDADTLLKAHSELAPLTTQIVRVGAFGHFACALAFLVFALIIDVNGVDLPWWAYVGVFWLPQITLRVVPALYRVNLEQLSRVDDVRAVGPLLDAVDLRLRVPTLRDREPTDRWVEHLALRHLPSLLNRMPAGDGPTLTREQANALRWLTDQSAYYAYFAQPGLNEKIESALATRRTV